MKCPECGRQLSKASVTYKNKTLWYCLSCRERYMKLKGKWYKKDWIEDEIYTWVKVGEVDRVKTKKEIEQAIKEAPKYYAKCKSGGYCTGNWYNGYIDALRWVIEK